MIDNIIQDSSFPQLSPLLGELWHGYAVTTAHNGDIQVCAYAVTGHGTTPGAGEVITTCGNPHSAMLSSAQHCWKGGEPSLCLSIYNSWGKFSPKCWWRMGGISLLHSCILKCEYLDRFQKSTFSRIYRAVTKSTDYPLQSSHFCVNLKAFRD